MFTFLMAKKQIRYSCPRRNIYKSRTGLNVQWLSPIKGKFLYERNLFY